MVVPRRRWGYAGVSASVVGEKDVAMDVEVDAEFVDVGSEVGGMETREAASFSEGNVVESCDGVPQSQNNSRSSNTQPTPRLVAPVKAVETTVIADIASMRLNAEHNDGTLRMLDVEGSEVSTRNVTDVAVVPVREACQDDARQDVVANLAKDEQLAGSEDDVDEEDKEEGNGMKSTRRKSRRKKGGSRARKSKGRKRTVDSKRDLDDAKREVTPKAIHGAASGVENKGGAGGEN